FAEMRSKFTQNATRRSLLASIASIYDLLGLISTITVKMIILHQKVCYAKCKWDELLPPDLMKEWKSILNEFKEIDSIEIDRNYCFDDPNDPITNVQIHSFSDASENMIAATIYGRFNLSAPKDVSDTFAIRSERRI
uniref:Uncharacterized protein n=1 Tax=Clytia hemisphaerica TaxID=252671 RepID=A0A7M5XIF7_9CNID